MKLQRTKSNARPRQESALKRRIEDIAHWAKSPHPDAAKKKAIAEREVIILKTKLGIK